MHFHSEQEIWANVHETRESLLQFLFPGNLGPSPSISSYFIFFADKNRQKITKKLLFLGSRSIKVINVDNPKKLVVSACYVKQHVYLQPFSC